MTLASGNLCEGLIARAGERPLQPAIIDRHGSSITFAELDTASARGAAILARHGIGAGQRVLVLVPISIDLYTVLLSVLRAGAVAVLLDPSAGLRHVGMCCGIARPDALIGVPKAHLLRLLSAKVRGIPRHFVVGGRWVPGIRWERSNTITPAPITPHSHDDDLEIRRGPPGHPHPAPSARDEDTRGTPRLRVGLVTPAPYPCVEDSPALLTFTSGSTGRPKAALRSHGLLLAQHEAISEALDTRAGAVDLITLPVFVLTNLASGVTSVLANADLRRPGAIDPRPVLAQLRERAVESIVASPALLGRLCGAGHDDRTPFASLRRVFTGGAPVFPHMLDEIAGRASAARVWALYGSTEAEPIAHIEHTEITGADRQRIRAGAGLPAGTPVRHVLLRVIQDAWDVPLAPMDQAAFDALARPIGAIGEIVVTGPHVLKGYLDGIGDEQTKFRVVSGERATVWHRTGDAGYLDDHGRLWLVGRASARITDAHGTIYPLQVEAAAHAHQTLHRAALVACRAERVLFIETDRSDVAMEEDLREQLAWAHILRVVRVEQIPMDRRHNAKIDYPALTALVKTKLRK